MGNATVDQLLEGKKLVFNSRYRNFHKVLKQIKLGNDDAGHGIYKTLSAQFQNFIFTVDDTPENAELIECLRKESGRDFVEVDQKKKNEDTKTQSAKIASLEAELAALKRLKDPAKPTVVVTNGPTKAA